MAPLFFFKKKRSKTQMHSLKYTSTRHFALSGFSSFALYELSDRWIFHGLRPKITYKKKKAFRVPRHPALPGHKPLSHKQNSQRCLDVCLTYSAKLFCQQMTPIISRRVCVCISKHQHQWADREKLKLWRAVLPAVRWVKKKKIK